MVRFWKIVLALGASAALASAQPLRLTPPAPPTPARDPAEILKKYDTQTRPALDLRAGAGAEELLDYEARVRKWQEDRAALVADFVRDFPGHPRAPKMLLERWQLLGALDRYPDALSEMEKVLSGRAKPSDEFLIDLLRTRATMMLRQSRYGWVMVGEAIEQFIAATPRDPEGGRMLSELANRISSPGLKMTAYGRIIEKYPEEGFAEASRSELSRLRSMGVAPEPFPRESAAQRDLMQQIRKLGGTPTQPVGSDAITFIQQAMKRQRDEARQLADLFKRFHDRFPEHPESLSMLADRWEFLKLMKELKLAKTEADELLSSITAKHSGPRQMDGLWVSLHFLTQNADDADLPQIRAGIEQFRHAAPHDERGGELMMDLASHEPDTATQLALYDEILLKYEGYDVASHAMFELGRRARETRRDRGP